MDRIDEEAAGFLRHVGFEARDSECEHWSVCVGSVEVFLANLDSGRRYLRGRWVLATIILSIILGYLAGRLG